MVCRVLRESRDQLVFLVLRAPLGLMVQMVRRVYGVLRVSLEQLVLLAKLVQLVPRVIRAHLEHPELQALWAPLEQQEP